MKKNEALLKSPVTEVLLSLTFPVSLGMLSTFLFQAVDTWFVGKLGSSELAALAFSSTVYMLLVSVFMGLAVGTSALAADAAGSGNQERASRIAGSALLIALGGALLLSLAGFLAWEPLFRLMGAGPEVRSLVGDYMRPLFAGIPFLAAGLTGSAVLRSHGDARFPEIIFAASGILNLILDRILIFGMGPLPEMGIMGAALATGISWMMLALLILLRLIKRRYLGSSVRWKTIKEILGMAMPVMGAQLTVPASMFLITYLAAGSGAAVVAALGVAMRIENLLLVGVSAVGVAVIPFIAQNAGAGESERLDAGMIFAGKAAFYWGIFLFFVLFFLGRPLAGLFTRDKEILSHAGLYFRVISVSYAGLGLTTVTIAILNGLRRTRTALKILSVKTFLIGVPLLAAGSFFGAKGLFAAMAAVHAAGGFYAARQMKKVFKEMGSGLDGRSAWKDYRGDLQKIIKRKRPE